MSHTLHSISCSSIFKVIKHPQLQTVSSRTLVNPDLADSAFPHCPHLQTPHSSVKRSQVFLQCTFFMCFTHTLMCFSQNSSTADGSITQQFSNRVRGGICTFPVYHHASLNCITVKQCSELVLSSQRKKWTAKFLKMNPSANDWFGSTRWGTNTKSVT